MVGAERFHINRAGPDKERLGFGIVALLVVQHGKVTQAQGDLWIVWPELFLFDRQSALLEWLGLRVTVLIGVQISEITQNIGQLGTVRPERFLINRYCALVHRLRFFAPSPPLINPPKNV